MEPTSRALSIWGISHAEAYEAERQGREEVLEPKVGTPEREEWQRQKNRLASTVLAAIWAKAFADEWLARTQPKPEAAKAPPGG